MGNSNDILVWDTEHFNQDTWDQEAHELYQDILWDAFEKYWAFPRIYDASASYNITLNELWAPHSVEEDANGGRILFIYENVSLYDSILEFLSTVVLYLMNIHAFRILSKQNRAMVKTITSFGHLWTFVTLVLMIQMN